MYILSVFGYNYKYLKAKAPYCFQGARGLAVTEASVTMNNDSDCIVWKPVVGLEDVYEVSNTGLIRRHAPSKTKVSYAGKIINPSTNADGYLRVYLFKDGKKYSIFVHRVVMMAFVGEPPEKYEVNHIDGDRTNNHLSNLEYISHGDNVRYAFQVLGYRPKGLLGERNAMAKITNETAQAIKRMILQGDVPQYRIADIFGVSRGIVSKIKHGQTWTHLD